MLHRGRSGRLRSLPALYQDDDDGNDLSDLGLSTGKKSIADDDESSRHRSADGDESAADQDVEDVFRRAEEPAVTAAAANHPAATENGYDRAIKDYVDFAESKRTSVAKCDEQLPQQQQPPPPLSSCPRKPLVEAKRRMSAPKIEEKVMLLKTWSQSTKDLNAAGAGELPKVDIGKRREIFEKICSETKAAAEVQQTAGRLHHAPVVAKKKSPAVVTAASTLPPPVVPPPTVCTASRPDAIEEIFQVAETSTVGKIGFVCALVVHTNKLCT